VSPGSVVRWEEVTAVFGGTFDPPHLGHREAVQGLFENPGVRQVLIVPSASPPLKPFATSTEHRYRMTELNFSGLDRVQVDYRELKRSQISGKPSFSIDTLMELRQAIPEIAFVVGADQLSLLHTWHRFPELLSTSHWIVLARQPLGEKTAMETIRSWLSSGLLKAPSARRASSPRTGNHWETAGKTALTLVPTPARELSSTRIREEIGRETDPAKLQAALQKSLFPDVLAYLMKHRIYGIEPP
jgi:nicotinate-nucleotide adenylyltransferase